MVRRRQVPVGVAARERSQSMGSVEELDIRGRQSALPVRHARIRISIIRSVCRSAEVRKVLGEEMDVVKMESRVTSVHE